MIIYRYTTNFIATNHHKTERKYIHIQYRYIVDQVTEGGETFLRRAVVEVGVTVRALRDDRRLSWVGLEGREGCSSASLFDVLWRGSSREGRRFGNRRKWVGENIGAVDEVVWVVASDGKLSHRRLEVRHHELLVVNHALPLASSALNDMSVDLSNANRCKRLTESRARAKSDWRRISLD